MTTQRKIEANRRNAQKSTGPRTDEGKDRVKLNALKHGMTAETVILPHEDAAAYDRRLESWIRELNAPGELGQYLAARAVKVSWQLDRADSRERARLTRRLREAPRDRDRARDLAVTSLMDRLLNGGEAPEPTVLQGGKDTRREGLGGVLAQLEASADGCRRLLAEWAAVKDELDEEIGHACETPARLEDLGPIGQGRILRLLGLTDEHAAIRARIDGRVAAIVRIRDVIRDAAIVEFLARGREEDPDLLEDEDDEPEDENEPVIARPVLDDRQWTALRQELRSAVEVESRRLQELLAAFEAEEDAPEGEADEEAAFDDSAEGERLHRYQSRWNRLLLRTLDAIDKHRKGRPDDAGRPGEESAAAEGSAEAPDGVVAAEARTEGLAAVDMDMSGAVGPPVQEPPAPPPPTEPPAAAGEAAPRIGHVPHDPPGSRSRPEGSGPQPKSAKQSHREAAPADVIRPTHECKCDTDGSRHRESGFQESWDSRS